MLVWGFKLQAHVAVENCLVNRDKPSIIMSAISCRGRACSVFDWWWLGMMQCKLEESTLQELAYN